MNIYIILFIVVFAVLTIINEIKPEKDTNVANRIMILGFMLIGSTIPDVKDTIIEIISQLLGIKIATNGVSYVYCWIFGLLLIILGIIVSKDIKDRIFILNIFGIFSQMEISDPINVKTLNLSDFKIKESIIDFVDTFKSGINIDTNRLIVEKIKKECTKFSDRSNGFKSCYTGMAPIPYTILAGTYLSNSKVERYFEYKRSESKYYEVKDKKFKKIKDYPEFEIEIPQTQNRDSEEIVVAISITRKVQVSDLEQFSDKDIVNFYVDDPIDNLIVSKKQLQDYKTKFINYLESIKTYYPNIKTIHLVASIPSCIALEMGKMINLNGNRIPEVIVYHFNQNSIPKYQFGIVVTENPFNNQKGRLIECTLEGDMNNV